MGMHAYDDGREGFARYLDRNPRTSFAAACGDTLVGTILCGHDGRRGFIYHLAVDAQMKRRGIGGALLAHAVEALRREGIRKAGLVVFADNEEGNAFWNAQGFAPRTDLLYRNGEWSVFSSNDGKNSPY